MSDKQQQPHTLEGPTSAGIGKPLRGLQASTSTVVSTPAGIGKPLRKGSEPTDEKEEPEFEVDLRIEGIAQDAILKDEERMGRIKEAVGKLKVGYQPKRESNRFDEEESQKIYEQGNIELHELGQISRTVQCNSCLQHLPEGLIFCESGTCLRPDSGTTKRLSIKFKAMIAPYYAAKLQQRQEAWRSPMAEGPLESQRCGKNSRQNGLRVNPTEMAGGRGLPRITVKS